MWWWGSSDTGALENVEYPFIAPGPVWPGMIARDRVLSMGQIELFDILTECKQMTHTKLNCLK